MTLLPWNYEYKIICCFLNTGAYEKITSLKKKHPNLKVLISMGGWDERLKKNYSVVAESADRRKKFIASVVDFIE